MDLAHYPPPSRQRIFAVKAGGIPVVRGGGMVDPGPLDDQANSAFRAAPVRLCGDIGSRNASR
jgi:hypothetical protein